MSTTIDRPVPSVVEDRIARARRALAAAEDAAGVRGGAWAVRTAMGAPGEVRPPASAPGTAPTPMPPAPRPAPSDDRFLDVPEALAGLFPFGAMRRGTTTAVTGSTTLELHLAAALMSEGAWGAFVARGDLGLAAAAEAGIALDRVAVVPYPGPDAPAVLGALVDGFDVVCVGPCRGLNDTDRRQLSARVRHRGGVLLSSAPWPGAELTLEVRQSSWSGVDSGHGVLRAERLVVESVGRGVGRRRTACVEVVSDGATTALSGRHGLRPLGAVGTAWEEAG